MNTQFVPGHSRPAAFEPLTLRSRTFRNRLWVSPMCQYAVEAGDGIPRQWHLVHLGSFARGGAGLVMVEATAVNPVGRIAHQDVGLWNDEQRDAFADIVSFVHSQGALVGVQLAHAGRKASHYREWSGSGAQSIQDGGWEPLAPSAVAYEGSATPRAMTRDDLSQLVADFVSAALRAVAAGFDVIEIHAAHGYLLNEFLSPLTNLRSDEYGGTLENRARIVIEIVGAVRHAIGPELPLFVRFSATDWVGDDGTAINETTTVAGWAKDAGADLFDISTGGLVAGAAIPVGPLYQVPFAAAVRRDADAPTSAVGMITTAQQAEEVIASGRADAVMLGREFLRDPHFPLRAAHTLKADIDYWPPNYARGKWRH